MNIDVGVEGSGSPSRLCGIVHWGRRFVQRLPCSALDSPGLRVCQPAHQLRLLLLPKEGAQVLLFRPWSYRRADATHRMFDLIGCIVHHFHIHSRVKVEEAYCGARGRSHVASPKHSICSARYIHHAPPKWCDVAGPPMQTARSLHSVGDTALMSDFLVRGSRSLKAD
jgi:hypothetical protein